MQFHLTKYCENLLRASMGQAGVPLFLPGPFCTLSYISFIKNSSIGCSYPGTFMTRPPAS